LKQYSRVSYAVRCQISAFLQAKIKISEIARRTGFHKSTIYRELNRNATQGVYEKYYNLSFAQQKANRSYRRCRRKTSIRGRVEKIVQSALKEGWSPEQIAGRMKLEGVASVSHESIYCYTRNHAPYRRCLRFHGRRGYGRYAQRMARPKWMKQITYRPKIVDRRSRFGDWERDTMYVKDRKTILVLTERKTRYTKISLLESHKAKSVAERTQELLDKTGTKAFTMTNDNGGEFRWKGKIGPKVFYCEPYKPQQRGTIENTIGTLRRYIKTSTDPKTVNFERLERLINLKPRKVLGYQTPYEVFYKKKVALAV
jgi:transposase, IS30 family